MQTYTEPVQTARNYYNSQDADTFYYKVWGGEDIHIGLYDTPKSPVFDASRKTVAAMADSAENLNSESKVLDIGSGYGGAARYLAKRFGCRVCCLNLSEKENERNREKNKDQGVDHLIEVVDGSFEEIPYPDGEFDLVWSQDAILHSGDREAVIREASRVLKNDGEFVFTDPMQTDHCDCSKLQPIYDRIHLESMGSPGFYREACKKYGLKEKGFQEHTKHMITHYGRIREETENMEDELLKSVSPEYINNMKVGLQNWVNGGKSGNLVWGIFVFKKQINA